MFLIAIIMRVGGDGMPRFVSDSQDCQQRINLSTEALGIMESDMFTFGIKKRSTFLNHVFNNFYEDADASIEIQCDKERQKLLGILGNFQDREKVVECLIKDYKEKLIQRSESYPKEKDIKFRINNENFKYLTEDDTYHEEKHYDKRIGKYFKAVIEEYARKTYRERERVYFSEFFLKIKEAIDEKHQISVELFNESIHRISPYKIVVDPLSMYHYLVGEEYANKEEPEWKTRLFSYRISNIMGIKPIRSKNKSFSEKEKRKMNEELIKRGPQFMSNEVSEVRVRLTKNGIDKYRRLLHLRPAYCEVVEDNIYIFNCTEAQAEFYFFKFGVDAQILAPPFLAERFKIMYENAAKIYVKKDSN